MKPERKKKNRNILPYVAYAIRIFFAIFAMVVAVLFFLEMIKTADSRYSYALCFLIPVIAVVVVGGDLYLRYKLDLKPLRDKKKDQEKNPLEF